MATIANVKTLDKSRPYGEVWGQVEGVDGARFSQDNALFDASGRLVFDYAPAAPVVEAPVVEAPVVEAPVVEAPVVEAPAVPEIPAATKKKAPPGIPSKE